MRPPPPLVVRYNPSVYARQVAAILCLAAFFVVTPFVVGDPSRAQLRFYGGAIILLLGWALIVARRFRDRRPQVIVDRNGLFVRDWHLGTVSWSDIALVARSSALRQPLSTRVFRRRLGEHLVVRFIRFPKFQSSNGPPLSWLQWLAHHLDNSDPIISPAKLDVPVTQIMAAIEGQISLLKSDRGH